MATRCYFPHHSGLPAPVTPSSWSAGWDKTTGVAADRALLVYARTTSEATDSTGNASNTSIGSGAPNFIAIRRYISPPLAAQTISGTVKGQIRCQETLAADDYTIALGIKVIQADGTDRGVLLAVTASDNTAATPPEMATSLTNRQFQDASENTSISLSSLAVSAGDRIVIELGYREGTNSGQNGTIHVHSNNDTGAQADLPENNTTTTAGAPWIEFSADLSWAAAFFSFGTTPNDGATATGTADPTAVVPPSGMLAGDLVVMVGQQRATGATLAVSATGGQTWNSLTAIGTTNQTARVFWGVFNGTWSADPSVDFSATTCNSVQLFVFRPATTGHTWVVNQTQVELDIAGDTTPTIVGQTTTGTDPTVTLGGFFGADDNTYGSISGTGWLEPGYPQYRNTSGSDQSASYGYKIQTSAGATGNVTKTQLTLGADDVTTFVVTFAAQTGATATDGTATGSGAATATGNAIISRAGSAAGSGVATATGAATAASAGSAAGAGAATAVGNAIIPRAGSAAGAGAAAAVGESVAGATEIVGTATGAGAATATGNAIVARAGSAAGAGAAVAEGEAVVGATEVVGNATGAGAAAAVGAATAASDGAASGSGAATAVGNAIVARAGSATGAGAATATGRAIVARTGSAAGAGAAAAVGAATAATTGSAAGTGAASGVGAATAAVTGNAAGTGAASAVGAATAAAQGSASGAGAAAAISAAGTAVGTASGTGNATAAGVTIVARAGSAAGAGAATATGRAIVARAGSASGTGNATATGRAIVARVGTASGAGAATGRIGLQGIASGTGTAAAAGAAGSAGAAEGSGQASGVIIAFHSRAAAAAGAGTASAEGQDVGAITPLVGVSTGSGNAAATSEVTIVDPYPRRFVFDDYGMRPRRRAGGRG